LAGWFKSSTIEEPGRKLRSRPGWTGNALATEVQPAAG